MRLSPLACLLTASLCAQPTLSPYGSGTPGSGGLLPQLWASSNPYVGSPAFALTIERGKPGASAAVLLAAASAALLFQGVDVRVDLATALALPALVLDATGAGSSPLALPASPALVGIPVYAQAFVADSGSAAPMPLAASRGLQLRLQLFGSLWVPTVTAATAVALPSGTASTFASGLTNANYIELSRDKRWAFLASEGPNRIDIYDVTQSPPVLTKTYSTIGSATSFGIWGLGLTPLGDRLYIIHQGKGGSAPTNGVVDVMDADPKSPGFGTAHPGGPLQVGGLRVGLAIAFGILGDAFFLNAGILGPASVTRYDAKLGSPTYHQQLGQITYGAAFETCWSLATSPDRLRVYVGVAPLGSAGRVEVIDAIAFASLGSIANAAFPRVPSALATGSRGTHLWLAGTGPNGLFRIDVDPSSPGYGTFTSAAPGGSQLYCLHVTDAEDLLYIGNEEYAARTLALTRSFPLTGYGRGYGLR